MKTPMLAMLFSLPLTAQENDAIPGKGVRINASESLIDMQWGWDAKKGFLLRPNPTLGERTDKLTPYYKADQFEAINRQLLSNAGTVGWLTILLFGNEDLLSHCFADYHFRRMGFDRSAQGLRMRIAVPNQGKDAFEREMNDLHRLLAVRILERRGIGSAVPELTVVSQDKHAGVLTRWAAEDALATLTGKPIAAERMATRYASLDEVLASVPDKYDAIASIEYGRMPFVRELPWLGRRLGLEVTLADIKAADGDASLVQLAGAQVLSDGISLWFFEVARKIGNFRIGRVTGTILAARGKKEPDSWVRIDGRFDAARLLKRMQDRGLEVDGEVATTAGTKIRVTNRVITVWTDDYPLEKTGGKAAALKQQGFDGENQVFVHLAKLQRLAVITAGAPMLQVDGMLLRGHLSKDRKLRVVAKFKNNAQAQGIANLIELGKQQMRAQVAAGSSPPGMDAKSFEAEFLPTFEHEDRVITMSHDFSRFSHARILKLSMGIHDAVSRQDGPAEPARKK